MKPLIFEKFHHFGGEYVSNLHMDLIFLKRYQVWSILASEGFFQRGEFSDNDEFISYEHPKFSYSLHINWYTAHVFIIYLN